MALVKVTAHLHVHFNQRRGGDFIVEETKRIQQEMLLVLANAHLWLYHF